VGTILWGLSGISFLKVRIRQTTCNQCNKCLKECKAGAISVSEKQIDQALCIGCFNCLTVCKPNAIKITPETLDIDSEVNIPVKKDVLLTERREFIKHLGAIMFVMSTSGKVFAGSRLTGILPENDHLHFVFPLGSTDFSSFKSKCTGCMICASKCPTKIIGPSMGSFNGSPVLPALSFQNNYCLEDCVACSQVCPTGALQEVLPENKKITKMASLELKLADCRIVDEGLECAICAEICPLQAIEMKQVSGQLYPVPVVLQDKCNGCGKCQYRCPVKKKKDIFWFRHY
jgi:ferredoxin